MPQKSFFIAVFVFATLLISTSFADSRTTKSLPFELELKGFIQEPAYNNQKSFYPSIATEPEYNYYGDKEKNIFKFKGFARYDSVDSSGSYLDIRELSYYKSLPHDFELTAGISKVFWGVTESVHLADIINQNDEIQPARSNAKLGQPMINLALRKEWGNLSYFFLPYFRERNFRGTKGRPWIGVNADNAQYLSKDKERHLDHAMRYNKSLGPFDFGIYQFYGTSREPLFRISAENDGSIKSFTPIYQTIQQTGIDAQYTKDAILLKMEAIRVDNASDNFVSAVGGIEYSFFDLKGSGKDVGILFERVKDNRNQTKSPITIFQDDIFIGSRLSFNDIANTEILGGVYHDLDYGSKIFSLEFKSRIKDNLKLEIFSNINRAKKSADFLYYQRRDSSVNAKIIFYW
jgi:hypothetical protein